MKTALLSLGLVLLASLSATGQTDQTWIDLDGTDDFLDLGADPILAGRTAFTVEMRMHFDNSEGEYTIIGQRTSDLNRTFVIQRWSGALYILFDGSNYASCPFGPCTSQPYHLAAVYDGAGATDNDRLKLYLDGVEQTLTFTGAIPATTLVTSPAANLVLGCEHNGAATQLQFLDGQFGEVCFWDVALTASEIGARVEPEVAGTEPGLVEYFHFDDGIPGADNTSIVAIAGGNEVSLIVPTNLAMIGVASNLIEAPEMTGGPNATATVAGHVVTASPAGATYQWLNCDEDMAPIPGATGQSYTTTSDGNYAVMVTQGDCSATSECVEVVTTGIATEEAGRWNVYPNPVQDVLIIELGDQGGNVPFTIVDPMGRVVRAGNVIGRATLHVSDLAAGAYLLQVGTGNGRHVKVLRKN